MSDWDNYSENLAFDPANSMPRCDIEELKEKVKNLEEKLRIATEALEKAKTAASFGRIKGINVDTPDSMRLKSIAALSEQALEKIKE